MKAARVEHPGRGRGDGIENGKGDGESGVTDRVVRSGRIDYQTTEDIENSAREVSFASSEDGVELPSKPQRIGSIFGSTTSTGDLGTSSGMVGSVENGGGILPTSGEQGIQALEAIDEEEMGGSSASVVVEQAEEPDDDEVHVEEEGVHAEGGGLLATMASVLMAGVKPVAGIVAGAVTTATSTVTSITTTTKSERNTDETSESGPGDGGEGADAPHEVEGVEDEGEEKLTDDYVGANQPPMSEASAADGDVDAASTAAIPRPSSSSSIAQPPRHPQRTGVAGETDSSSSSSNVDAVTEGLAHARMQELTARATPRAAVLETGEPAARTRRNEEHAIRLAQAATALASSAARVMKIIWGGAGEGWVKDELISSTVRALWGYSKYLRGYGVWIHESSIDVLHPCVCVKGDQGVMQHARDVFRVFFLCLSVPPRRRFRFV